MDEALKKYIICMEYIESHPELKEQYEAYKTEQEIEERKWGNVGYEEGYDKGSKKGHVIGVELARRDTVKMLLEENWSLKKIKEHLGFNPEEYL